MSETIEQARQLLNKRLLEVEEETKKLKNALRDLGGGRPESASTRTRQQGSPRRRARKRAARGQRKEQFLTIVAKDPKATPSQIAAAMDASPDYVYTLIRRLVSSGEIKKTAKGYRVGAIPKT